jgi:lysophospholipase L1-like esterase
MLRRWQAAMLVVLAILTAACEPRSRPGKPPQQVGLPSSMAALGDSITAGYGSCLALVVCGSNSWSTGTNPAVNSHYRRILKSNTRIRDRRYNFAVPNSRAASLQAQASSAVRAKVQYVTILIGANDACRRSVADMTSPDVFRAQIDAGLRRLADGLPNARVLLVSIPNLYRLWEIGHTNERAVRAWARGICPSLLANPTSTAAADVRRRGQVRQRVAAYNRALSDACRAYGRKCKYDEGAAHRIRFDLAMVNHLDYFHPSAAGQASLAEATFPRRFTW